MFDVRHEGFGILIYFHEINGSPVWLDAELEQERPWFFSDSFSCPSCQFLEIFHLFREDLATTHRGNIACLKSPRAG